MFKVNLMIISVKCCKPKNEFHIPLLGGDKGVGISKNMFTFLVYNILPVVQIKEFKQVHYKKYLCPTI